MKKNKNKVDSQYLDKENVKQKQANNQRRTQEVIWVEQVWPSLLFRIE